jgi:hypothetical protein
MDFEELINCKMPEELIAIQEDVIRNDANVDLSRAKQIDVDRDMYLEAQARNMTLSQLLETDPYDPSQAGSPLDAFERQLALKGVRTGGNQPSTVELFYRNASMLLPEFIMREIRHGMSLRSDYSRLPAASTDVPSNRYTPMYIDSSATDEDLSLRPIGEGAEIPQIVVTEQKNTVTIPDYGVALKASYKSLRHRTTSQFKVILWYIGFRLQSDKVSLVTDVILNGDGNGNPAQVINTDSSGSVDYDDLVKFYLEFYPYQMNTVICHKTMVRTLLNLAEYKDPSIGFKFQTKGEMVSPLGATIIRCDDCPADSIIGIDNRFAVEEVKSQPLMVEFDKIIEQKFEEAVISESVSYAKIVPEASLVLDTVFA